MTDEAQGAVAEVAESPPETMEEFDLGAGVEIAEIGDDLPPTLEDGLDEPIMGVEPPSQDYQPPKVVKKAKRGKGRPSNKEKEKKAEEAKKAGTVPPKETVSVRPFPVPATRFFSDSHVSLTHKPMSFIHYLGRIKKDPELASRLVLYVYRNWPVVDRQQGSVDNNKAIDVTDTAFESLQDILHRYGTGDYTIYLKDVAQKGERKNVCSCFYSSPRELDNFPPVLDISGGGINDLVLDDPKNRSYLEWRRRKGLPIPGENMGAITQAQERASEEEMANNSTVETLTGLVERLVDKNLEDRPANNPPPAYPPPMPFHDMEDEIASRSEEQGGAAAVEVLKRASEIGMGMISQAVDRATSLQTSTQDPVAQLKGLADAVSSLVPKQDNSAIMAVLEDVRRRGEKLEERLAQSEKEKFELVRGFTEKLQTAAAPQSLEQQLNGIVSLKKTLKSIMSDDEDEDEDGEDRRGRRDKEPWYAQFLPLAIPAGMFLMNSVNTLMHNAAVAKTGQGQPEHPPAIPTEALPDAVRDQMAHVQSPAGPGNPQVINHNPNPNPGGPSPMDIQKQQVRMFLNAVKAPILHHLNSDLSGHDFAEWLIGGYGSMVYEQVRSLGPQQIRAAIAELTPDLEANLRTIPEKAESFLEEFCQGLWPEDGEDGEEGEEEERNGAPGGI